MTDVINSFRGEHAFLSNFYQAVFEWRGRRWFCGEQAFQYAKTDYPRDDYLGRATARDLAKRLLDTGNPKTAKKYGREIPLDTKFWNQHRVQIMREITHAKFATAGNDIAGKLIRTGDAMLIEGNDWGDKFWGRCLENGQWVGLNKLGVILMEERGYWLHYGDK